MSVAARSAVPGWIVAADLVPWWFAVAFWISFVVLAAIVVRDVRRVGGPRKIWRALQRAIDERAAERQRDPSERDGPPDDPSDRDGGEHHPA